MLEGVSVSKISSWQWRLHCHGTISLCMIMKNEEALLPRCLDSVRGLVDEIIIVDTGSTDDSVAIARRSGAHVLSDPWQDDFARPRNIGLRAATKDWILILDPDEVVSRKDHQKIRDMTATFGVVAYQMDTWNYTQNRTMQGFRPNSGRYAEGRGWAGYTPSTKTRLFKSGLGFRFVGRWHELVDYSIDVKKHRVMRSPVPVHHYGGEISQSSIAEKQVFYLRMGEKKVADDPGNDQSWWELGVAESICGYFARAVRSYLMSMRDGSYTADRMFQLAHALGRIGNDKERQYVFEKAICKLYPSLTHCEPSLRSLSSLVPHLRKK